MPSIMFEKIFQAINEFFDPEYVDTTPVLKKENIPVELTEKLKKMVKESGMFEHAKNYKTTPLPKTIPSVVKLFADLLKDEDYLAHSLQNLKDLAEDEGLLVKVKPVFNHLVFSSVNQPFNSLIVSHPQCLMFFTEYLDFIENNVNVNEIVSSLNFINEEKKKLGETALNKPINELLELQSWIFFEKIKKSSEGQYKMYFNDWTLKNSQIIEHTVKAMFKLFLQLDLVDKGVGEDDIKELIQSSNTIGKIIQYFDPDGLLSHLPRLRIYRNAAFHSGVDFIYSPDATMKKLVFEDDYGKFEVNMDEFIADFRKLMIFIATINYLVANELFKAEHDGKTIFQVNYEYARNNGMMEFLRWSTKEMEKNRYYKYFLSR